MDDLNIKFSPSENTKPKIYSNDDLNFRLSDMHKSETEPYEAEEKPYEKEEYFQLLGDDDEDFDLPENDEISEIKELNTDFSEEISSELFEEIAEETAVPDYEETETEEEKQTISEEVSSALFDEITEKIAEENRLEEESKKAELSKSFSEENVRDFDLSETSEQPEEVKEKPSDAVLKELARDTRKGKYDFLNLGAIAVIMLFLGMTFIFMKQEDTRGESVLLTAETAKTGEYTQYVSEKYTSKMPLSKFMTQANVVVKNLLGKSELKFVRYEKNEPPDGPIEFEELDNMGAEQETSVQTTVTTSPTTTEKGGTTAKVPQNFEVSKVEVTDDNENVFTGRPIRTTTSKETTTLDLPKATEDTTTGKVNLILPD